MNPLPASLEAFSIFVTTSGSAKMNSPADPDAITALERLLVSQQRIPNAFTFPPTYVDFLKNWDGGIVNWEDADIYVRFMVVSPQGNEELLSNANSENSILVSGEISTYEAFSHLVFFATDEGGNLWAFDPRDGHDQADQEISVYYCDHENGNVFDQSEHFGAFIRSIVDGSLSYHELT